MFDIHQQLFDEDGNQNDYDISDYIHELSDAFSDSPEAKPIMEACRQLGWCETMMDLSINHLGNTPAEMTVHDFNEVVYELMPRKVTTEPENAGEIIAELKAFWKFIARQYGLKNAQEIYDSIDDSAASDLEAEFGDSSNFGMAKSFFTMGLAAGYDMTTEAGLHAFQAAFNSRGSTVPLPGSDPRNPTMVHVFDSFGFENTRPHHGAVLKKKRLEKKRQRAAKKKNRR
ncbi:MAG: uncharacterized protein JWN70_4003 [Planctomycetaceae bacterium]|nr:uncharacterized protein [Planctomycetaceae bacterium]